MSAWYWGSVILACGDQHAASISCARATLNLAISAGVIWIAPESRIWVIVSLMDSVDSASQRFLRR
jgi:hypothetical protein